MASTENITAGVKAIKISKTDALGNDQTLQLQEGELLSLVFSDLGVQRFTINSIAEYSDYYLYYVTPKTVGVYDNSFELPGDSSSGGSGGSGFINTDGNMLVSSYPQYTGFIKYFSATDNNSVQTFNNGVGLFTAPSQKNPYSVKVNFTSSIFSTSNNAGTLRFYISSSSGLGIGNPGINIPVPANSSGSANAKTISGSVSFTVPSLTTGTWGLRFINYYGSNTFYMPSSSMEFHFDSYVTSSTDTDGLNSVVEPYTTENIAISDYNAIINNVTESRINEFYADVDYTTNAVTAVNAESILNGSATRAQVQYSNYTTARVVNPRYKGSKNTANMANFNEGSGSVEAPVETDGVYFAYFDWIGGTTPELINKAGFHVKYLIDSNANVYTPNLTGSYYYNLINSFNANDNKVNVLFDTTSGNVDNLLGVKPVIRPGVQPRAIAFSQTGSTSGALSSISFLTGVANNYAGVGFLTNQSYLAGGINIIGLSSANSTSDLTFSTTGEYASVLTTNTEINIAPRLNVNLSYTESIHGYDGDAIFYFQKSTNGGSSWSTYYSQSVPLYDGETGTTIITGPYEPAVSGSLYRSQVYFSSDPVSFGANLTLNSGTLTMLQNPVYGGTVYSGSGQVYWLTGSASRNVISGSQFTSILYGGTQVEVTGSGYDAPYLPFDLQVGDEIRFQASETNTYQIIDVNAPNANSDNELYLTLDRNITSGTNLQSFFIRRFVPNPNFVIVDALKDSNTGGGSGFLMPEYASLDLTNKFDGIITTLTEKNLI